MGSLSIPAGFDLEQSIRKHFPYPNFNAGQYEAIHEIVSAFLADERFVFAQVPTGVGKSAIAVTVHRVLREIDTGHRTTITTVTKSLQDQYMGEFPEIVDLRGKTNYDCPRQAGPYHSAACRELLAQSKCSKKVCPYVVQRDLWCNEASLRCTNSSFMIEAHPCLVMKPENRANLIVIDECHNIDTHLVTHSTLRLSKETLTQAIRVIGSSFSILIDSFIKMFDGRDIGSVVNASQEELIAKRANAFYEILEGHIDSLTEKMTEDWKLIQSYAAVIEELQIISDKFALMAHHRGEWLLSEYDSAKGILELKPVYANQVSDYALFRKADRFLLMSATICGENEFARSIGTKQFHYIEIDNPIPVKSRRVVKCSLMKVAGAFSPFELTQNVDKIIDREKGAGLIHTVSYKLAEQISKESRHASRMKIHRDLGETLKHLRSGGIILSPSMEQGYDLKGDLARWQIIAKYPYDYLGDPWIKLNTERSSEWYARRGILRVVQASGRAVRGVDDWAVTYVVDSEIERHLRNSRHLFPEWFLDGVVDLRDFVR